MRKWECTPVPILNLGSLELTAVNVRKTGRRSQEGGKQEKLDLSEFFFRETWYEDRDFNNINQKNQMNLYDTFLLYT